MSNLNARLAQRFLALVLLPRVRSDIATHQRLHFALFQALKKATYKPGAFFKVGKLVHALVLLTASIFVNEGLCATSSSRKAAISSRSF